MYRVRPGLKSYPSTVNTTPQRSRYQSISPKINVAEMSFPIVRAINTVIECKCLHLCCQLLRLCSQGPWCILRKELCKDLYSTVLTSIALFLPPTPSLCIYSVSPALSLPLYETYFNNFILTLLICLQVLRPFVGFHTPRHRLERIDSDRPYHRFHGLVPLIHLTSVSSMLILFYVFQRQPNHPISTVLYLPTSPVLQPSNAGF